MGEPHMWGGHSNGHKSIPKSMKSHPGIPRKDSPQEPGYTLGDGSVVISKSFKNVYNQHSQVARLERFMPDISLPTESIVMGHGSWVMGLGSWVLAILFDGLTLSARMALLGICI